MTISVSSDSLSKFESTNEANKVDPSRDQSAKTGSPTVNKAKANRAQQQSNYGPPAAGPVKQTTQGQGEELFTIVKN